MVEYRVLSDHIRLPTSILLPTFSILHKKPTNNLNSSILTSTSNLHPIGKHPFNSHSSILLLLLLFLADTNTHPSQTKSTQLNSNQLIPNTKPPHLTQTHLTSPPLQPNPPQPKCLPPPSSPPPPPSPPQTPPLSPKTVVVCPPSPPLHPPPQKPSQTNIDTIPIRLSRLRLLHHVDLLLPPTHHTRSMRSTPMSCLYRYSTTGLLRCAFGMRFMFLWIDMGLSWSEA